MTGHLISSEDRRFQTEFEKCSLRADQFGHQAHLRLAYVYLAEHTDEEALALFKSALLRFLQFHGIDAAKFHETITRAWILAVRHFMERSPPASSFAGFIGQYPKLLDSGIMMTHYSKELLYSAEAKHHFVEPDLSPIPRHEPSST